MNSEENELALTRAEFAMRSLAIEALQICVDANLEGAGLTVIPADPNDPEDADWWRVTINQRGGKTINATCRYPEVGDGE